MELINGKKTYKMKGKNINALDNASIKIDIKHGSFNVIMGHSGSGKSTIIQILGLLDTLDNGKYLLNGNDVNNLSEDQKAQLRMNKIGFIFQSFYLNPNLRAYENVILPMMINKKIPKSEYEKRALDLLSKFNLLDRANHFPNELSGGEQQRVAIARALANDPDVILADEPTGNLDVENEREVFEFLKSLSKSGKCIIVVSHNTEIKKYADNVYVMENGKVKEYK